MIVFQDNAVELVGFYGSDESHALSAWTSTRREIDEERRGRIGDLLTMLAKNGHHTPFEKSTFHFWVRCDTASHIHIIKHRIAVSVNAESARYKEIKDNNMYIPADWPLELREELKDFCTTACNKYHKTVAALSDDRKRAKESSRYYLPYASQVVMDVAFNFRSFMHFQGLRNSPHAQVEIRQIAQQMLRLVKETGQFPLSLQAFGYAD